MRILALSDIYEIKIVNELIDQLSTGGEKFDVVMVAGGISIKGENGTEIIDNLSTLGEKLLFVPGGNDERDTNFDRSNIINLDGDCLMVDSDIKIGFFGLGGVPERSIRHEHQYPYRWIENLCYDDFMRKLKTNYEKIELGEPDYIVLVSHSPPYHISDYSKKITLDEFESAGEIGEENMEDRDKDKKKTNNPVFLGSRILKEFTSKNKVDLHIFGHVHKEGGKKVMIEDTLYLNVAHLSILPYKLTGRKFCIIGIDDEKIDVAFKNVVNPDLPFDDFIGKYL